MRYLSIDLGEKRTGVAAGDDETCIVSPLEVVNIPRGQPPHDRLGEALMRTIESYRPDALVLGLPLNMDGTEGAAAKAVRAFGERLSERASLPVHFQDERLTSYAAEQSLNRTGRTHKQKKDVRDALAAAEILRDFLEASPSAGWQRREAAPPESPSTGERASDEDQ